MRRPSYPLRWLALWVALVGALSAPWWLPKHRRLGSVPPAGTGAQEWFFVVRVPEVSNEPGQAEAVAARLDEWLTALREAGYAPIRLSEVFRRLAAGEALPPRAVALTASPGQRRTHAAVEPVLRQHAWPATWITDASALRVGDRRFLSQHEIDLMAADSLWDLGFFDPAAPQQFHLSADSPQTVRHWGPEAGRRGLNRDPVGRGLAALHPTLTWTGEQLIERLRTEEPIDGRVFLSILPKHAGDWQIAQDAVALPTSHLFAIQAPREARSSTLTWPSTLGCHDLHLELTTTSLVGELWLWLRADPWTRRSLRVGFVDDEVVVEEESEGRRVRLASYSGLALQRVPFRARLRLQRDTLAIEIDDRQLPPCPVRPPAPGQLGVVKLMVYDRVRGAARADAMKLELTPLADRPTTLASAETR